LILDIPNPDLPPQTPLDTGLFWFDLARDLPSDLSLELGQF
jgi:hypothetical protein